MKSILIPFFVTCFTFGLSAQFRTEYVQLPPEGVKPFPYKDKSFSLGEGQTIFPYEQVKDSLSGKWILRKNPVFDPDDELGQWYRGDGRYSLQIFSSNDFLTVPPHLDSLSDGIYAYYFSEVPLIDGDTLKFQEPTISALIPIKNNLVDGEVRWFYPDGLIKQIIMYSEGQKNGPAFMQNLHISTVEKSKNETPDFSEYKRVSFSQNLLHGTLKHYKKSHPMKGVKQVIFEEEASYETGLLQGSFVQKANGVICRSGEFDKGKGVGKWKHYQWENGIFGGKLVLSHAYELNTEEKVTRTPFFIRTSFPVSGLMGISNAVSINGDYTIIDNHPNLVSYFYLDPFQTNTNIHEENPYYVPNCLKAKLAHLNSPPEKKLSPVFFWGELVDSLGNTTDIASLTKSCGVVFNYLNLEVHYPNGQLRYKFDFTQADKLFEQPVYYPNGNPMYEVIFDRKTGQYIQSLNDSSGKLLYKYSCDEWGRILDYMNQQTKKEIKGRKYDQQGDFWAYYNPKDINPNSSKTYVHSEKVSYTDSKLRGFHHYTPVSRSGVFMENDPGGLATMIRNYQFSEDYRKIQIKDSLVLGKLWYTREALIDLTKDTFKLKVIAAITNTSIPRELLDYIHPPKFDSTALLMYQKEVFSGTLNFHFSDKRETSVKSSKNRLDISYNRAESNAISAFINGLDIPVPHFVSSAENETEKIKEVKALLAFTTVSTSIEKGKRVDEIRYIAKNGYPLQTINSSTGVTTTYNNYPQITSYFYHNEAPNYEDSLFSYVSSISKLNQNETSTLTRHFSGDTLRYYFSDRNSTFFRHINFSGQSRIAFEGFGKQLTKLVETDTVTRKVIAQFDLSKKLLKTYYSKTGLLKAEYFFDRINFMDSIHFFTETSDLKEVFCFSNKVLIQVKQFENGLLKSILQIDVADSVNYSYGELNGQLRLELQPFRISKTPIQYYHDQAPSGRLTKYTSEGKVMEKGEITNGRKTGSWDYYYPQTLGRYQIDFKDTIVEYLSSYNGQESIHSRTVTVGKIRFFSKTGEILSEGELSDFSKTYSCMEADYTEQYQINYSKVQGENTEAKTIQVVNHYPNGNKMNEGQLVNGLPDGLWHWYQFDGSLNRIGKYKNGLKTDRWLEGDLSKVRFLGETCLDPDSKDFTRLLKEIEIRVTYYENGEVISNEYHSIEMD